MGTRESASRYWSAFLQFNGHQLNVPAAEAERMVLRAAASEIDEDEWTAWVERSTAPVSA